MAYINGNETLFAPTINIVGGDTEAAYQNGYNEGYDAGASSITMQDRLKEFIDFRDAKYLFNEQKEMVTAPINYDDTANATNMDSMFNGCTALTTIPNINCENVEIASKMFMNCVALESSYSDRLNMDKVVDTSSMFSGCESLTYAFFIGETAKNMSYMFNGCTALTEIPVANTESAENMTGMFQNCRRLEAATILNTTNVESIGYMFASCTSLTYIPAFDLRSVINTTHFVGNCTALTEIWVRNIKANLQVGSSTQYGHRITVECLLHLIKEVINTGTEIKLTVGNANLLKLNGIYVKLIEVTDEMRAEDEFIDQKYPFEVCESTDEGAMTLDDYRLLKNLALA